MMPDMVVTIILAAGNSSRFGTHKGLIQLGGKSIIRTVAGTALASSSGLTIVVLGKESEGLKAELGELPVKTVYNAQFKQGRTGSIKSALESLSAIQSTAIVIFPIDCPFVPPKVLNLLIETLTRQPLDHGESYWIVPEHDEKRGHPILLFGPVVGKIQALEDDYPLRDFLKEANDLGELIHITVPVETRSVLDNIDTRDDLAGALDREGLTRQGKREGG
ncbi:MAG: nucleotidyltransferase family protein [Candidatus Obscuribacterales bacterium]|nr:nucleotidyltransferase family protein [Candidatus Obscuribacterales bacterium]